MASWALVFLVIVASVGFGSALGRKTTLVQFGNDENLKNKEVTLKDGGDIIFITIKDTETGSITTVERIKKKNIQITKHNGDPDCYVTFEDEEESECSKNVYMNPKSVPAVVAERCDGDVYRVEPTPCEAAVATGFSCGYKCWTCGWSICCGWKCGF